MRLSSYIRSVDINYPKQKLQHFPPFSNIKEKSDKEDNDITRNRHFCLIARLFHPIDLKIFIITMSSNLLPITARYSHNLLLQP